jgi:hypothetical protein
MPKSNKNFAVYKFFDNIKHHCIAMLSRTFSFLVCFAGSLSLLVFRLESSFLRHLPGVQKVDDVDAKVSLDLCGGICE